MGGLRIQHGQLPGQAVKRRIEEPSPANETARDDPPRHLVQRASMLAMFERYEKAIAILADAYSENPRDEMARGMKGQLLFEWGRADDDVSKIEKGLELLQEAVQADPKLDSCLAELVSRQLDLGRPEEAMQTVNDALGKHPNFAPTLALKGRLLRHQEQLAAAKKALTKAISLEEGLSWIHYEIGEIQLAQGETWTALESFAKAIEIAAKKEKKKAIPDGVKAWVLARQGDTLARLERFHEAEESYDKALALLPQDDALLSKRAKLHQRMGRKQQAVRELNEAIRLEGSRTWAYVQLAETARDLSHYGKALKIIDKALREAPKHHKSLMLKSKLLQEIGEYEAAIGTLERVIAELPNDWRLYLWQGSTLKYLGPARSEQALKALERAKQLAPTDATVRSTIGDVLRARGDVAAAQKEYRAAADFLERDLESGRRPIDARMLLIHGWVNLWLDHHDQALRLLAHAKMLAPHRWMTRMALTLALAKSDRQVQVYRELNSVLKEFDEREISMLCRRGILRKSSYALHVAMQPADAASQRRLEQLARRIDSELTAVEAATPKLADVMSELDFVEPETARGVASTEGQARAEPPNLPDLPSLVVRPTGDRLTPTILLDPDFRILDWNEPAALAFDRTLEGFQFQNVGGWVTDHLTNPLEVAERAKRVFGGATKPQFDKEKVHFRHHRYGGIKFTKRAFLIPNDDGEAFCWLMTLDPTFEEAKQRLKYTSDLLRALAIENTWSEHSLSYDRLLDELTIYHELINVLLGDEGPLEPIPDGARVLDLGAGTGNLTLKLALSRQESLICAVDKNREMLEVLRAKCEPYLCAKGGNAGVVIKMLDISRLGVLTRSPDRFDYAILSNVLYSVPEPEPMLKALLKLLKPRGEIRIAEPRRDSDVDALYRVMRDDLESKNKFEELSCDYYRLYDLNKRFARSLFRSSNEELKGLLLESGFSEITHVSNDIYAGQSMLVCAKAGEQTGD